MIRRSFRAGLTLGVLTGLAFAIVKMLGARAQQPAVAPAAEEPWPRLQPDPVPSAAPPVVQEAPRAAPDPLPSAAPVPVPAAPPEAPKKASTATKKKKPLVAPWVEPTGGVCPTSHPVKGKLSSKIFHLPGMLNYDRTRADRCYRDVTAAESDGLRPAKR